MKGIESDEEEGAEDEPAARASKPGELPPGLDEAEEEEEDDEDEAESVRKYFLGHTFI